MTESQTSQTLLLEQIAIKSTQQNQIKNEPDHSQSIDQDLWQNYRLFDYQVSGKTPKLISLDNKHMLKQYNTCQYNFYNILQNKLQITHPYHSIVKFMPKLEKIIKLKTEENKAYNYSGNSKQYEKWMRYIANRRQMTKKHWKDYSKFIVFENLLCEYSRPNVFDIKIGMKQGEISKKVSESSFKNKFRLNGFIKSVGLGESGVQFISKNTLKKVVEYEQVKKYMSYFYSYDGQLLKHYILKIIQELKQLVLCIKCMKGWRFVSTSICLYYESVRLQNMRCSESVVDIDKCRMKYIDFSRTQFYPMNTIEQDNRSFPNSEDTCLGLQSIIKILKQIIQQASKFTGIAIEKDQLIVPNHKLNKYLKQLKSKQ